MNRDLAPLTIEQSDVLEAIRCAKRSPPAGFVDELSDQCGLADAVEERGLVPHLNLASRVVRAAINSGASTYQDLSRTLVLEWNRLQSQVLRADDSVKVMSIHQAKGLEFPVVYIPRLEERLLPYVRKDSPVNVPEERRLLFVAIMRAEQEVVLSLCETNDRGWPCSPSPFFDDIRECSLVELA